MAVPVKVMEATMPMSARAGSLVLEGALTLPETCLKPIARDARSYRLSEKTRKIVRIRK